MRIPWIELFRRPARIDLTLLHHDRDFDMPARITPLQSRDVLAP